MRLAKLAVGVCATVALVAAGLGVALMREDLALQASEPIAILGDTRLVTSLSFLYRREREDEPAIRALREVVAAVFHVETIRGT